MQVFQNLKQYVIVHVYGNATVKQKARAFIIVTSKL